MKRELLDKFQATTPNQYTTMRFFDNCSNEHCLWNMRLIYMVIYLTQSCIYYSDNNEEGKAGRYTMQFCHYMKTVNQHTPSVIAHVTKSTVHHKTEVVTL